MNRDNSDNQAEANREDQHEGVNQPNDRDRLQQLSNLRNQLLLSSLLNENNSQSSVSATTAQAILNREIESRNRLLSTTAAPARTVREALAGSLNPGIPELQTALQLTRDSQLMHPETIFLNLHQQQQQMQSMPHFPEGSQQTPGLPLVSQLPSNLSITNQLSMIPSNPLGMGHLNPLRRDSLGIDESLLASIAMAQGSARVNPSLAQLCGGIHPLSGSAQGSLDLSTGSFDRTPIPSLSHIPSRVSGLDLSTESLLRSREKETTSRGSASEPFPEKLYRLLIEVEEQGKDSIISFTENGKAFRIHNEATFFSEIVPKYFKVSQLSSFKRQLNLYGFEMITSGPSKGSYSHKDFIKSKPELCKRLRRRDVKFDSRQSRRRSRGPAAPDFYSMPPITSSEEAKAKTDTSDKKPPPDPSKR